jgi:hypothetical protein
LLTSRRWGVWRCGRPGAPWLWALSRASRSDGVAGCRGCDVAAHTRPARSVLQGGLTLHRPTHACMQLRARWPAALLCSRHVACIHVPCDNALSVNGLPTTHARTTRTTGNAGKQAHPSSINTVDHNTHPSTIHTMACQDQSDGTIRGRGAASTMAKAPQCRRVRGTACAAAHNTATSQREAANLLPGTRAHGSY